MQFFRWIGNRSPRLQLSPVSTASSSRDRGRSGFAVEPLEDRRLLTLVPVTLNITEVIQVRNPDGTGSGDGDYFARVTIGANPAETSSEIESSHFEPGWTFTRFVDDAAGNIPVRIELFDSDTTDNDVVDIRSSDGQTVLDFVFNPADGKIQGAPEGSGDADGDAKLFFDMFVSTPVAVTIIKFEQIDEPDDNDPTEDDGGDYNFGVKIDNYEWQDLGGNTFYNAGFVNETFVRFVDPSDPLVRVRIMAEDFDDFSDDDHMDISARPGVHDLFLTYNLYTQQWIEDDTSLRSPINFSTGDGDRGKIYFDIKPGIDTDGDSLPDRWETDGIDADGDGDPDFFLNSDPRHKDLFVEVDAMVGLAPDPGAISDVIAAFAAVPNSFLQNPDGLDGINLRVQLDESDIPMAAWSDGFTEFYAIKNGTVPGTTPRFGTLAERADANAANILAAKELVYRYAMFAQSFGTQGSSGQAEIRYEPGTLHVQGGNDFYVALGAIPDTRNRQAGTFMHELGHTLGLLHSGDQVSTVDDDQFNNKANYHSVIDMLEVFDNNTQPS
jgi:hypothetical protein